MKVKYDIEKELEEEYLNIEKDIYRYELKNGMYRDMKKIEKSFREMGIDVENI